MPAAKGAADRVTTLKTEPSARANGGLTEETLIKLGDGYFLQIRSNPKQSSAAARPMTPMVTIHSMPVGQ